jgi:hypothetical protein
LRFWYQLRGSDGALRITAHADNIEGGYDYEMYLVQGDNGDQWREGVVHMGDFRNYFIKIEASKSGGEDGFQDNWAYAAVDDLSFVECAEPYELLPGSGC